MLSSLKRRRECERSWDCASLECNA